MEAFLKGLTDFSDHKSSNFNSETSRPSIGECELDLQSDERIIRSFKELRDRLKESTKELSLLRTDAVAKQLQINRLMQVENNLLEINQGLKERSQQQQNSIEEFKKRVALGKDKLKDRKSLEDQLQFFKTSAAEFRGEIDRLKNEKNTIMELSAEEKLILEEQICRIELERHSEHKYLLEIEDQLAKQRDKAGKIESQFRKLQIKYDQEIFSKEWTSSNFQKKDYEDKLKQVEEELAENQSRFKKEKDKRYKLEERVLQLEETSGLWNVKAETYEKQVSALKKKIKKLQNKCEQGREKIERIHGEKVGWEQKFIKSCGVGDELIARVKRELTGDVVELARSCQFKLGKLKEERQRNISQQKQPKSKKHTDRDSSQEGFRLSKPALSESTRPNNVDYSCQKRASQVTFGSHSNAVEIRQNQPEEDRSLQLRIRRQRQQMERQLKEKMMFRKLEVSGSPERARLRGQYLKYVLNR